MKFVILIAVFGLSMSVFEIIRRYRKKSGDTPKILVDENTIDLTTDIELKLNTIFVYGNLDDKNQYPYKNTLPQKVFGKWIIKRGVDKKYEVDYNGITVLRFTRVWDSALTWAQINKLQKSIDLLYTDAMKNKELFRENSKQQQEKEYQEKLQKINDALADLDN